MPALGNPSITSPRQGDRSRASRVSPRNRTGQIYAQQHAEEDAKKSAASTDINELKRRAFQSGREQGYAKGLEDGWDACIRAMVAQGILDPDKDQDGQQRGVDG